MTNYSKHTCPWCLATAGIDENIKHGKGCSRPMNPLPSKDKAMTQFTDKLDAAIETLLDAFVDIDGLEPVSALKTEARQQILEAIVGAMGEDEAEPATPRDESGANWNRREARNKLRAELRQAFGITKGGET